FLTVISSEGEAEAERSHPHSTVNRRSLDYARDDGERVCCNVGRYLDLIERKIDFLISLQGSNVSSRIFTPQKSKKS
ncbi:MAG: hypothetical protein ABF730_03130, partial [Bifidobacterium aquikefiri]